MRYPILQVLFAGGAEAEISRIFCMEVTKIIAKKNKRNRLLPVISTYSLLFQNLRDME
jgi:hypothetical protein